MISLTKFSAPVWDLLNFYIHKLKKTNAQENCENVKRWFVSFDFLRRDKSLLTFSTTSLRTASGSFRFDTEKRWEFILSTLHFDKISSNLFSLFVLCKYNTYIRKKRIACKIDELVGDLLLLIFYQWGKSISTGR